MLELLFVLARDSTEGRQIAGRYLGAEGGRRFAAERTRPDVLLRLSGEEHVWDLSAIRAVRRRSWDGLRVSLVAKLRLAERTAGVDGNRAACKALGAFVAEVGAAATSGTLTEAVALAWIGEADAVRADLDCSG